MNKDKIVKVLREHADKLEEHGMELNFFRDLNRDLAPFQVNMSEHVDYWVKAAKLKKEMTPEFRKEINEFKDEILRIFKNEDTKNKQRCGF